MNEKIKFAAFDVDGTILPYGQLSFSPKIVEAFKKLKENKIKTIIATGREFVTIGKLLDQLNGNIDYFIGANGAFIYDVEKDKIIHKNPIYYADFEVFYNEMIDSVDSMSIMDDQYGHVSEKVDTDSWFLKPHTHKLKKLDDTFSQINRKSLFIITVNSMDKQSYDLANKVIEKNHLNLSIQSAWEKGLFLAAKGVTKSSALRWLMIDHNASLKNLIAFGDGENDVEMIRDAGIGVVMQGGSRELIKYADYIAPRCDDDGVYTQLKKLNII
ncbi:COF family HAD hydrolase protein [Mycoplasmopsis californica]|uniref:Cof-type HAD-IIB family hydrolase n=1 Tax=Mycoplasmopsis equigenitalium TaxID=114883 RepID=A0ABY5J2H9_9BACT|nr:HAD family hydrolase [Mycoplasmopsis equigenitalium]UUD36731.1 Cof-type HAD-IIB family hydrolase [Mycoplasmopsis equigenitalium]VEU69975.1 COF family HAD hydrolase protein [Mycoplasmopsis californica]